MRGSRFDVIVVGGGPAGLSAALTLGRARLRVLVVDAGEPANAAGAGIGGLLGHPAEEPVSTLRAAGTAQLRELVGTVARLDGRVRDVRAVRGDGRRFFAVDVDGAVLRARALLLAGGLRYLPPALPGMESLWGRSVFHCPFCDGWESRDQVIAVSDEGARLVRRALLLRGWSREVVAVGPLSVADRAELAAAGVRVRTEPVAALEADPADATRLRAIRFADGSRERADALFVAPRLERHDALPERLGCAPSAEQSALLAVDADGRTSVPGVYAAGDLAEPVRSVANAVGSGSRVGKAIALELLRPLDREIAMEHALTPNVVRRRTPARV
ncbi:NAD(P)/FAD-dependent oxidoreductase [Conexibacter stalactiti]|uniref:NAD(P)/FAD-dependent oxidoreductase n=1 Tax=Conexibacter stalactiti TaxID=1940611 RepID=A0ABU4HUZ1_9ACTN|nr:NAD(P)/FAD-dependent oxidoreductase [Conexibacter stalactiti]MDW5597113.1 NAD(P)/FAD-dependent oxidoreductase [Conexibacter stalactiti]MEC5037755.1 NAD(P)/FAD-dependent oxidoreductase [Conexibacter stalactiti]